MPKRDKDFLEIMSASDMYHYIPMYDRCKITITITKDDTPETVAKKIEQEYNRVIDRELFLEMCRQIEKGLKNNDMSR